MCNKPMRNLVIGSEGFIGTALCKFLEEKGEKVTHFDIKRSKKEDARTAVLPLKNFDRVYFLAWEVGGAKYLYKENTQLNQLTWNLDLLRNVMLQLGKHKTPFLFVSSQLADETDSIYGATKNLGELWTKQIGGTCVRLWNPYGTPEADNEKSHVVADFLKQALTQGKIEMMTTGEEKRQFSHMFDICAGFHHVLHNNLNDSVYDLSSFQWSTIKQMADLIAKHTHATVIVGSKKGIMRNTVTMKGKPVGWEPKIGLDEGVKMMVDNAKKLNDKKRNPL